MESKEAHELIDYIKELHKNSGLTFEDFAQKINFSRGALFYVYKTNSNIGVKFLSGVLRLYEGTKHYRVLSRLVLDFLTSNITDSNIVMPERNKDGE
jgi:hypothetical protein